MIFNKHLRQVFPSSVTPCVLCVCTCLYMCCCEAMQADLCCWEPLTQQSESHSGGEKHITSPLPACLTHSAVMLILLVSMATMRCEGGAGKWLQWRFCRQSSSFPCHGNSDRRWIYSDLCTEPIPQPVKPHSEVFHASVLNVHSTQYVGVVETELRTLINARRSQQVRKIDNCEVQASSVVIRWQCLANSHLVECRNWSSTP